MLVPEIGLGCMTMTTFAGNDVYGEKADEAEAIATIHRSKELGGNFIDTADVYGPLTNERLIAKAIKGQRQEYIIATKFGEEVDDQGQFTFNINASPAYVKKAAERSLKNLQTDYIDIYYLHRLDKTTPIEETIYAMSQLVKEGKVKYIGLSEVSAQTIKKAHDVHPITAVQTEYSLFERTIERLGILDTLQELGIGFVAYSPLGRGFLTGNIKRLEDISEDDFRRTIPRYQGENFNQNLMILNEIEKFAKEKSITTAQLAIAWIIAKGYVPIPGTKKRKYVEQNIDAGKVILTREDLNRLEGIIPLETETGLRYSEAVMKNIDMQ
ncbi:aldo/keto reductase [Chryseobacterium sp. RLHN22]|uniref:aldo/keto reductase n=1 Tax=Chryseobacterium sp. RLHN22 TaxID=3437885 RepID=UPI003D9BBF5F